MDNASKALMIAGETLIAILVIGLIASAISKFGGFSANMTRKMDKSTQEEFNNNFFNFEARIDITADEIVGIANFCKHSNDSYELFLKNTHDVNVESPYYVEVVADKKHFFDNSKDENFNNALREFLEQYNDKFFMCNASIPPTLETSSDGRTIITPHVKNTLYDRENDILLHDKNNGRKGYVKRINFELTKINSTYLNIVNRDEYIINKR